jgi:hypothetical protein
MIVETLEHAIPSNDVGFGPTLHPRATNPNDVLLDPAELFAVAKAEMYFPDGTVICGEPEMLPSSQVPPPTSG